MDVDFPTDLLYMTDDLVSCAINSTIGDNSVIGAGSVVTKDIPANVVAFGTPCKVYREIDEHDEEYYLKINQKNDDIC